MDNDKIMTDISLCDTSLTGTSPKSFFTTLAEIQKKFTEKNEFDHANNSKETFEISEKFLNNWVSNKFEPKGADISRISEIMNETIKFLTNDIDKDISSFKNINNLEFIENFLGETPLHIKRDKFYSNEDGNKIERGYMINDFIQLIEQLHKRLVILTNKGPKHRQKIANEDLDGFKNLLNKLDTFKIKITNINENILNKMNESRKQYNLANNIKSNDNEKKVVVAKRPYKYNKQEKPDTKTNRFGTKPTKYDQREKRSSPRYSTYNKVDHSNNGNEALQLALKAIELCQKSQSAI